MEPVNFIASYSSLITECANILADRKSVYQAWLVSADELELLWSRLLNIAVNQQKYLLQKYLLHLIFKHCGHISLKSEYQLNNFINETQVEQLFDFVKQLTNKSNKLKYLRQIGIADEVSVNLSVADLLLAHNLSPNLCNVYKKLASSLKSKSTLSLDLIFDLVLEHEQKNSEHIIAVAKAHLHEQLRKQLFDLPIAVIQSLPVEYNQYVVDYKLQSIQFQLSDEKGAQKKLTLVLPTCCPWSDNLIQSLRCALLTYWATKRVAWHLLNTVALPNENDFYQEPAVNINYLVKAMLQQDCEQLLKRTPPLMEQHITTLCKNNINQVLKTQLYRRANVPQLEVLERLAAKNPKDFNQALMFGPGSPACKTSLLRMTGTWSNDGKILKTLQ